MKHSVHDLIAVHFTRSLVALKGLLAKARAHAEARKFDENLFLQTRVAPDMFPFVKQIQIATDGAKGAAARLTGKTAPVFADDETTLAQLIDRIDRTIAFLQSTSEKDYEGYELRTMAFPWRPGVHMQGFDYLSSHAIPNFYFHMTTAYTLLRSSGVQIGKNDFLGEQNWVKDA